MVMRFLDFRRLGQLLAATLLVAPPLALQEWAQPADAATNVQALVAQAEHNTNTVRTLIHNDQTTISSKTLSVQVSAHGSEDEVHNREQDYESVNVKGRTTSGKVKTLHYTVDIIFLNGSTYYRTTLSNNQWKSYKGMTFADPYTGGWQRGRTTVPLSKSYKFQGFQEVGTSGGETQVRSAFSTSATASSSATAGTVDLWISGGATPYVVQEDVSYHTIRGTAVSVHFQMKLGPFNTPMVIEPPTTAGGT